MRLLLLPAFCLLVFAPPALWAQKALPPPVVKARKLFELDSQEGGFRAKFPAAPQKTVKPIDTGFGKTDYTTYQHASLTALHMVAYLDYPTAMKDNTELGLLYDQMKDMLVLKQPSARVIEQREIVWGDYLGRDYVIEVNGLTITLRAMIIEQRLFQLMVSTRGLISKATESGKKYHHNLAEEFLNSFTVTKLPEPKKIAVELPSDFALKVDGDNFRSDFFKFSMKLPKGWTVLDAEEAEYLKELGLQSSREETPKVAKEMEFSLQKTSLLLTMTKISEEYSSVFMVAAEKVSVPSFLPSAVTDNYIRRLLEPSEEVVTKTTLTKLGGVDFAWMETFDTKSKLKQRLYVANRDGIALQITFTYRSDAELQIVLKSMESIRFDEFAGNQK
jgi:hypothetical protein